MATLVDTSMQNCNLKHTLFYNSERTNVSFKMSNTREALFDRKGSALQKGDSMPNGTDIDATSSGGSLWKYTFT